MLCAAAQMHTKSEFGRAGTAYESCAQQATMMSEDAVTKVRCGSPHSCSPRARRAWCKHAKERATRQPRRDLALGRAVIPDASTSCILKTCHVTAYFSSMKTIVYSAKFTQSVHRTISAFVCCRGDLCNHRYVFFREKIVVSTSKTIY